MNPYQAKRAEHKARDAIKTAGAMKLHRIVDLEVDEYSATEGCFIAPAEPLVKAPRIPRDTKASAWIGPVLGALALSAVSILAYIASVVGS